MSRLEMRVLSDTYPASRGSLGCAKPLAEFVAAGLPRLGHRVRELRSEDWGWRVEIEHDDFPLWVGCANVFDPEGMQRCFVRPTRPVRRWFRRIDTRPAALSLAQSLHCVLADRENTRAVIWEN